jgi:hypothetical protein
MLFIAKNTIAIVPIKKKILIFLIFFFRINEKANENKINLK